MRFRCAALALVMGLLAASAEAAPFTFEFVLPDWTGNGSPALFGTNATFDVTVDNLNPTPFLQTYLFSDVTQLNVTTNGTFTATFAPTSVSLATNSPFFTTDAAAIPVIDFSTWPSFTYFQDLSVPGAQVSFRYLPANPPGTRGVITIDEETTFQETQVKLDGYLSGAPAPVPEPATLTLMALGAGGLGFCRRRQRG